MHLEKQKIFDEYAKRKGHKNWQTMQEVYVVDMNQEILEDANGLMNSYMVHVMAACDLVQKAQQERIAENSKKIFYKFFEEDKPDEPRLIVQANSQASAFNEAHDHLGPETDDLFYQTLTDEETLIIENNLIK